MKRLLAVISLAVAMITFPLSTWSNSSASVMTSSHHSSYATTSWKPYAGQTITAALAAQSPPPKLLQQFTKSTGITVHWVTIDWDALQTKITAAMTAHAYFADVTDVDWSRVGAYYVLKWFIPLNKYFPIGTLKHDVPQLNAFIVNGQLVGMPMDSSFMVTTVNSADFRRAGIKSMPRTLSQYDRDLEKLRSSKVMAHPLGIPLAAAEGLSTYWYELTAAMGGHVLSRSFQPLFTSPSSPGYRALAWMVHMYKSGLVPKPNINMVDSQEMQNEMARNKIATIFSDYSGQVGTIYNVPSTSTVVGAVRYLPTPGLRGPGPNLDNPDGIGIPVTARHVGAAIAFIRWLDSTVNQARWAGLEGSKDVIVGFPLPMRLSSMRMLTRANKTAQGAELTYLLEHRSQPVFLNGPPPWYSQFSASVYTNIHAAAEGTETVAQAIQQIASTVDRLRK